MVDYHRTVILFRKGALDSEDLETGRGIQEQLAKRAKYLAYSQTVPLDEQWSKGTLTWGYVDGVATVTSASGESVVKIPSVKEFYCDLESVFQFANNAVANTVTYRRLKLLESKYEIYHLLNSLHESEATREDSQDFEGVPKVDNHLHLDASYTASMLVGFIREKLQECGEDVVERGGEGQALSLRQVMASLGLTAEKITIDNLGAQNQEKLFHRFDHFNASYNPFGEERLRTIFMSPSNVAKGRYFAELITRVVDRTWEMDKSVRLEPRLTLFGLDPKEWNTLAEWVVGHKLLRGHVRWLVQIPRLYSGFRDKGLLATFQHMTDRIFTPLFQVSVDPLSNPTLHLFLQQVVGLDSVDDESRPDDLGLQTQAIPPEKWDSGQPPYSYYQYYLWANLTVLNHLRMKKGLNTFQLRPHSGESGPNHHLCTTFLLAHGINHGILLDSMPALQYLYYLAQVGISMSPLSNNVLFRTLDRNPFGRLFHRGLNVTLGTDDPLQFHSTKEPLLEEYTIAKQFWKLSVTDLCEIARNSVLQSGYGHEEKQAMLGENYLLPGPLGNDIRRSNLPACRLLFRHENVLAECQYVLRCLTSLPNGDVAEGSDDPSLYAEQELSIDWLTIAHWHPVAGSRSHIIYWRADAPYNLPNPLTGTVGEASHLSFTKGDYLTLVHRVRSQAGGTAVCMGLDQSGRTGLFPLHLGTFLLNKPGHAQDDADTHSPKKQRKF